jgi:rare lipoprotein A
MRSSLPFVSLALLLAACAGQPERVATGAKPAPAKPAVPGVKIGKPYQVFGVTYYPEDDRAYEKVGIASWYGPTFHEKATANGEIYNQDDVTAAHKTLPMPSWVEVTNLDNGRKLVVRINDRGPFVDGRIIDLSRRSAQLLGVDGPGLAKVRVKRVFPEGDWARGAPVLASTAPAAAYPVVASAAVPQPPAPTPVASAAGGRFVQVAALSDEGRAKALASVLSDYGPAAATPAPGGLWRVRLGPVDAEVADRLLWDVRQAGYPDARLVN